MYAALMTYAEQLKNEYLKNQKSRHIIEYAKAKIQAACNQAIIPGNDPLVSISIDNTYTPTILETALKELGFPDDSLSIDIDYLDNPVCIIDLSKL